MLNLRNALRKFSGYSSSLIIHMKQETYYFKWQSFICTHCWKQMWKTLRFVSCIHLVHVWALCLKAFSSYVALQIREDKSLWTIWRRKTWSDNTKKNTLCRHSVYFMATQIFLLSLITLLFLHCPLVDNLPNTDANIKYTQRYVSHVWMESSNGNIIGFVNGPLVPTSHFHSWWHSVFHLSFSLIIASTLFSQTIDHITLSLE